MIWHPVVGYEGYYEVSDTGLVKSMNRVVKSPRGTRQVKERILKKAVDPYGYCTVSLSKENVRITKRVHQLVCAAFLGPTPKGKEILHGAKGVKHNQLSNLSFGTRSENAIDRQRDGTQWDASKPVTRSDGALFKSATEAAKVLGLKTSSNITSVCKGRRKVAGKYSWKYTKV